MELDREIILAGEETNPLEASKVADEIVEIGKIKITADEITKRVESLLKGK